MPYNIAGITFLAFGNGAPDVFSSIASFTGSSEIPGSIGMGALLGAGVFVTTVVVGSLALVAPLKLTASHFIRDIIFYLSNCIKYFKSNFFSITYVFIKKIYFLN